VSKIKKSNKNKKRRQIIDISSVSKSLTFGKVDVK